MPTLLAEKLLQWYATHARRLPWRDRPEPYAVWVSEIMLQQTRVETVLPYYEKWMQRFPSLAALAAAPLQAVLATWEGLGYYSRARNLHQAARAVVAEQGGELPGDPAILRRLPGIGRYTAGAIASIAFGQDEPALDGNIRRVLARLFDVSEPARAPQGERRLWQLAEEHLPAGRAGDYNQALMDLGALVCTPRAPRCADCPLAELCKAKAHGVQEQRPVVESRPTTPHHVVTAAVIWLDGKVLIAQRPSQGLLGGLWEFPGGKVKAGEDLASCLQREICEELDADIAVGTSVGVYRHAYTHFRVTLHAFACTLEGDARPRALEHAALAWVTPEELAGYPMGKIDRQIAKRIEK